MIYLAAVHTTLLPINILALQGLSTAAVRTVNW